MTQKNQSKTQTASATVALFVKMQSITSKFNLKNKDCAFLYILGFLFIIFHWRLFFRWLIVDR